MGMVEMRNLYKILVRKPEDPSEDRGKEGRIILECILKNKFRGCGLD
jgi:hypothetical protein